MRFTTRRKTVLAVGALLAIAMLVFTAGPVTAKKPAPPPPPPTDPGDTGVVYFWHWGAGGLTVMDPDGSDKDAITPTTEFNNWGAPPSRALHGGERWWLQSYEAEGSHPDGSWRYDLYAVNESGDMVLLIDDPDLQLNATGAWPEWANDGTVVDGKISFLGKRWVQDPVSEEWSVSEWGLYVATLDPSDLATSDSLDLSWTCHDIGLVGLDAPNDLHDGTLFARYDWSADGLSIAFRDLYGDPGIHRTDYDVDSGTWSVSRLTTTGDYPRWSPDDAKIVFTSSAGIEVMKASDGSGRATIVADPADTGNLRNYMEAASWSPNGTHLVYVLYKYDTRKFELKDSDVYRVKADGSGALNLTADTDRRVSWAYWRDE